MEAFSNELNESEFINLNYSPVKIHNIDKQLNSRKRIWFTEFHEQAEWRELITNYIIPSRLDNDGFSFNALAWSEYERKQSCAIILALRGYKIDAVHRLLKECKKNAEIPLHQQANKQFRCLGGTAVAAAIKHFVPCVELATGANNPFVMCAVS